MVSMPDSRLDRTSNQQGTPRLVFSVPRQISRRKLEYEGVTAGRGRPCRKGIEYCCE